jgi:outer membrane scaffolding protein for murein synthesis (MipA/OmpV family)
VPVLGAGISYYVDPRWTVSAFGEGLKIKNGDLDGWMLNAGVSTDYMLSRHFGVGIGYNVTSLRMDVEQSDFNGRVTWTTQGLTAYGQLRF